MRKLLARDIIDVMESSASLMPTRSLLQFIADWDWLPHRREEMLESSPPESSDPFLLAATASVVDALCDRDGIEPPKWAKACAWLKNALWSGLSASSPLCQSVKRKAPAA